MHQGLWACGRAYHPVGFGRVTRDAAVHLLTFNPMPAFLNSPQ
jgi:hypothetical protein